MLMKNKVEDKINRWIEKTRKMSLIHRMIIIYLLGPILLYISFGLTSYFIIQSILDNKMQVSIQSDLNQTMEGFNKVIGNIRGLADQMAIGESGKNLSGIVNEINPYEKYNTINDLKNEINIISFINNDIGFFGYYNTETQEFYYANSSFPTEFKLHSLPTITKQNEFTFYGPHKSFEKFNNELVVSVTRQVPYIDGKVYVYIESYVPIETRNLYLQQSEYAIVNSEKKIIYNTFDDTEFSGVDELKLLTNTSGHWNNYYWQKEKSPNGFDLIIFIQKSEYNNQIRAFIRQSLFVMLLFSIFFAFTIIFLWRIVIKPLNTFKKEIQVLQQGILNEEIYKTNIPEYDSLLDEFLLMKIKIQDLFIKAEESHKKQAKMNVERLMYQINPHFLMNTLNTIHWMAVSKKEHEIDTQIMALNKLLFYNLKMDNNTSTVADEINALQQYVTLQKTRFSFEYTLEVLNQEALQVKIPRFILQPLVENAIYHGLADQGKISIKIDLKEKLELCVIDNGEGMTQEALDNLIEQGTQINGKNEMGIGLSYVIQILKSRYGDHAKICINSYVNKGTTVFITIPINEE